uniref:Uncharacterized protein n=1 Tax=Romanomermis culicivorax TaxID=13658 RepID=A0A915I6J4_ROMCU
MNWDNPCRAVKRPKLAEDQVDPFIDQFKRFRRPPQQFDTYYCQYVNENSDANRDEYGLNPLDDLRFEMSQKDDEI